MATPLKNIELRSEEVQEIMGKVPPSILRWGTTAIVLILLLLVIGSYFFKYPEKIIGNVLITNNSSGILTVSAIGSGGIQIGQIVRIRLDNYPEQKYGFVTGTVQKIGAKPDTKGFYTVTISLPNGLFTNYQKDLTSNIDLIGKGDIIIKQHRMISRLLNPLVEILHLK
jgi:hypothetical protein